MFQHRNKSSIAKTIRAGFELTLYDPDFLEAEISMRLEIAITGVLKMEEGSFNSPVAEASTPRECHRTEERWDGRNKAAIYEQRERMRLPPRLRPSRFYKNTRPRAGR